MICKALAKRNFEVRKNGAFAKLSVQQSIAEVQRELSILLDFDNDHDSHCLIGGFVDQDLEVATILLELIIESKSVREVLS
jgi:hypothetical protein